MQVRFVSAATPDRIAVVAALADKVWNEHYAEQLTELGLQACAKEE